MGAFHTEKPVAISKGSFVCKQSAWDLVPPRKREFISIEHPQAFWNQRFVNVFGIVVWSEFHVNVSRVGGCAAPVSWLLGEGAGDLPQSFIDANVLGEGLDAAGSTETLTEGGHA